MFEDMGVLNLKALDASDIVYRKWIKLALSKMAVIGWIVEVRKQVAGSGCIWLQPVLPKPEGETGLVRPYLFSMYTEPQFRRMGIASRIVRQVAVWCRRNGYPRVILHTSKKGRSLYRKHGFARSWEMRRELKVGHN
jgi:GNAT superfamily N-acetyltransferase